MRVSVIRGRDLTAEHVKSWSAIQSATAGLESPFFRPEFTLAVAHATDNVFVAILHEPAGTTAGFFPFQVVCPGRGRNLEMCDYQGVIAPTTLKVEASDIIRKCGLKIWEFDHLFTINQSFQKFYFNTAESPIIEVLDNFEAYKASLNPEGRRHLAKAATSARKVQRELGPLVLVDNCTDPQVMQTMHRWRAQKYSPLPDWSHQALEVIRTTNTPAFAGVLSALYAGDELIAVHFGIRSREVLHWWFPAYNPDLPNYAPGILLLLHMVEHSRTIGISRIDLGKGQQDYKRRFGNTSAMVATGSVDLLSLSNLPRIVHRSCSNFVRHTPALLHIARRTKRIFCK